MKKETLTNKDFQKSFIMNTSIYKIWWFDISEFIQIDKKYIIIYLFTSNTIMPYMKKTLYKMTISLLVDFR